jgi:starvation-inducible outer membrane lipoprotein
MLATAAVCLGLSACAASPQRVAVEREQMQNSDVDWGAVVAVNQWAERRGATLRWIHYPTTRKHDDGS